MKSLPEYSSLDEKSQFFAQPNSNYPWVIETEAEFDSLYNILCDEYNNCIKTGGEYLLFRGVCEAKYKTFTSAQRSWLTNEWKDTTPKGFLDYITSLLDAIKQNQNFKDFYKSLNVVPNDLLYLSLLQHYGASSPMLDFTHSLDMGLFFMIDGTTDIDTNSPTINQYFSLQLLDTRAYKCHIVQLSEMLASGISNAKEQVEQYESLHPNATIDKSLIENIDKMVKWHNPSNPGGDIKTLNIGILDYVNHNIVTDLKGNMLKWTNIRIVAQRGVLLLYTDIDKSLEEFFSTELKAPALRCFNIHKRLKDYILKRIPFDRNKVYPSEESIVKDVAERTLNSLTVSQ